MEWSILVQSSKKGTSCTLTLPPSFLPVTPQLSLGSSPHRTPAHPVSIPQLGTQGFLGMAEAKGLVSARKHLRHRAGQPSILTRWQGLCLTGQHGSVTLSAPGNGTTQIWSFLTFRVHQADCQPEPGGSKMD